MLYSRVVMGVLRSMLADASRIAEHLTNTGRRSAYERVAHLLLELRVRLRRVGLADNNEFSLPLTQELMADALGLTTIHTNRMLRLLR